MSESPAEPVRLVVVYHSGFGHTTEVAKAVARGVARLPGAAVKLIAVGEVQGEFADFNAADGIIFGCPTYMGGPSAEFKTFIDAAAKLWFSQAWKDKIAAGFTNSQSFSGDKLATLQQLMQMAMQHSMLWVSQGIMPATTKAPDGPTGQAINRLGSFMGLMTQSNNVAPADSPPAGDIETAELFGERVARATQQWVRGRRSVTA